MNTLELIVAPGGRRAVTSIVESRLGAGVRVVHDPDGAPELVGSDMHISISHSRGYAAVALHPSQRIGVDIEEPRPEQLARVAKRFLSAAEAPVWSADLLAAWTIKEAVYKAAGTPGLALGLIDISRPGRALLPDGRRYALETTRTEHYTVTTARPMMEVECQIDDLTTTLESEPNNADALYRRGALRIKLGLHGPALTDFNSAAEIDPAGPAATAAEGLRAILAFHLPANP